MEQIADGLLIAGALAAAFYCWMLSRRLRALKNLDSGLGQSIATLSRQVDEVRSSLEVVRQTSIERHRELSEVTARAEMAAGRLELLLASIHEGDSKKPVEAERVRESRKERSQKSDSEKGQPQSDLLDTLRQYVEGMNK
jgi:hypothetical protein